MVNFEDTVIWIRENVSEDDAKRFEQQSKRKDGYMSSVSNFIISSFSFEETEEGFNHWWNVYEQALKVTTNG